MDTKENKNTSHKLPPLSVSKYMIVPENTKENTQKKMRSVLGIVIPTVIIEIIGSLKRKK